MDATKLKNRDTERRLITYLRPMRWLLYSGLACAAMVSLCTVFIGWLIKWTVDAMASQNVGRLNGACAGAVALVLVKGIFDYGQNYLLSLVAQRVTTKLRDDIFAHLQSLSLSYFSQHRTGNIMATLTSDVPAVQNMAMNLRDVVSAPITIVGSLALLFYVSWRLALVSVCVIPLMAIVITRIGRRIRRISDMVQINLADITTIAEETLSGVRIIKSFATEQHEVARFSSQNERTFKTVMGGVQKSAKMRPVIQFIGAFGIAFTMWFGGIEVAHHQMSTGGLLQFLYLLNAIANSASNLGGINVARHQALAAAERIFREVLDQQPEVKERPNARLMPPINGQITFHNVTFSYQDSDPVLQNVSFNVEPGEVVAVVGPSGAGKSTLVDLIPRFYDPDDGYVEIDEIPVKDVKIQSLRRQIGIVPQDTWLFGGTLKENIAYGNKSATDEEIQKAAYAANAYFIESLHEDFDTVVGERGVRLSGGERQRIAIARAILMNPRILILDEATSNLDASSEALVQEALDKLMHGRTTIVIAHRLSTVLGADRILVLDKGRIIETGTHTELLAMGGLYARLYETQFRAELPPAAS